jgi:chromosome segregation ATPase
LNDINTRITTIESYDILNEVIVVKDQFDEEISKINTTIENNEETVSVALNDINIRITTIENNGVTNNNLTELKSKVESLEITVKNQETKITELQTNFDLVNQKYNKLVSTLNKILGVDFNGDFNSDFAKDIIL